MIDFQTLASLVTVLAIATFIAIVAWAASPRQKPRFESAANLPFALPDDATADAGVATQSSIIATREVNESSSRARP